MIPLRRIVDLDDGQCFGTGTATLFHPKRNSRHVTTRRRFSSSKVTTAFLSSLSPSSTVVAGSFVSSLVASIHARRIERDND